MAAPGVRLAVGILAMLAADWRGAAGAGNPYMHCSKYQVPDGADFYTSPELLDSYQESKCEAYPRRFHDLGATFGTYTSLGTDLRNLRRFDSVCGQGARKEEPDLGALYTPQYPMASYMRGERICLLWPSLNRRSMVLPHAAMTEQGRSTYGDSLNAPDGGMYVLRSEKDARRDATLSELFDLEVGAFSSPKAERVVAYLGKSEFGQDDMKGYSNCPMFGQNDALAGKVPSDRLGRDACGQCFLVPYDMEPGTYTFYWYWRAKEQEVRSYGNPNDYPEEYITCFDVTIEEATVEECPLAGDNGQYPGNLPGTGRYTGEFRATGYTVGGPIVASSVNTCTKPRTPRPPPPPRPPPSPATPRATGTPRAIPPATPPASPPASPPAGPPPTTSTPRGIPPSTPSPVSPAGLPASPPATPPPVGTPATRPVAPQPTSPPTPPASPPARPPTTAPTMPQATPPSSPPASPPETVPATGPAIRPASPPAVTPSTPPSTPAPAPEIDVNPLPIDRPQPPPVPAPSPGPAPGPAPAPASGPTAPPAQVCAIQQGVEYDGTELSVAVMDLDTPGECCDACAAAQAGGLANASACNTFAHCPADADPNDCTPRQCVLKFSQQLPAPVKSVNVWTSGTNCAPDAAACVDPPDDDCPVQTGTKRSGVGSTFNDASDLIVMTPAQCCSLCQRTPGCRSWACDGRNGGCALKTTVPQQVAVPEDILFFSGVVDGEGETAEILEEILPVDTPCAIEDGVDFPGNDIEQMMTDSADECCRLCEEHFGPDGTTPDCFAWTRNIDTGMCSLKNKIADRTFENELLVGATVF